MGREIILSEEYSGILKKVMRVVKGYDANDALSILIGAAALVIDSEYMPEHHDDMADQVFCDLKEAIRTLKLSREGEL